MAYFKCYLKIKNPELGVCLDTMARKAGEDVGASACHGQGMIQ